MFGIDTLAVASLLILAAGGEKLECPDRNPTKINMAPKTEEVKYDSTQTLRQLQEYSMDTVDPFGFHGQTITQAFMKGKIVLEHNIKLGQSKMKNYDAMCVWYDTITVEIKIDPTIVIAKEVNADPCMRKAVLNHELKHVRVDREIVNRYAKSMGKKLFAALKDRGFSAGPFKESRGQEVADKMQRVVHQILDLEYQKMGIERMELQREVDSLKEYNRVDEQCPAFAKKKKKLYSGLNKAE
jgi:hypothetical protein